MWNYDQCVAEFARRRKGSDTKKTHQNVHMRYELTDTHSMFVFKMYDTDIAQVRQDLLTRKISYTINTGAFAGSPTTRERIKDITGQHICGNGSSPIWRAEEQVRVWCGGRRKFQLGTGKDAMQVEVWGYPYTPYMAFENGMPVGDFRTEQFRLLDAAAELERKRKVRPWLEAIKVAVGLTLGTEVKTGDNRFAVRTRLFDAIDRGDIVDMAPVLAAVHAEWAWYAALPEYKRRNSSAEKHVYGEITSGLLAHTRRDVPWVKVTGYLLDAGK